MTEEQIAINRLRCGNTAHSCKADYIQTAIKALEDVQKYRAIGTVEGYESAIKSSLENYNLMKEYKARVEEFESIGTVEDFQTLKKRGVLPVAHISFDKEDLQGLVEGAVKGIELDIQRIRNQVIDEFAERLRLECLDSCFREVHMYSILKIAEKMKGGELDESSVQ